MSSEQPYNPNGIWKSREKKFVYEPRPHIVQPAHKPEAVKMKNEEMPHDTPERESGLGGDGRIKKIVIGIGGAVVLIAIAAFVYFFFIKPAPAPLAQITFTKPVQVAVGDPFPFVISYANNSGAPLASATLILTLPNGVSFLGQLNQQVMQWSVGNLLPGASSSVSSTLIATTLPNTVVNATVQLAYDPDPAGNPQAATNASANIVIGTPAVGLTITAPSGVASGQNFTMSVAYVNNTPDTLADVRIGLQFPPVFTFVRSSTSTDSAANDEWDVGALTPGASGTFTMTGSIAGQNNAPYPITATANANFSGQDYAITTQTANITMEPSALGLTMALNNSQEYVAGLADTLNYTISYTNNSAITIQNAVIMAKLVGAMFDFGTLRSAGSFNSITNAITWTGADVSALQNIAPGQSGAVNFTVNTAGSYPIRLPSDNDYLLKAQAEIVSPTVPPGVAASTTVAVAGITNKVGGEVVFDSAGYWKDPSASAPKNTGPYPPVVNKPTEYTIHWDITNYATDIANVTVSAYLQSGTTCTGKIESNIPSSTPTCNATTGLVSWTIPQISATTGVISSPAEAIFQVVNTPAINQLGQNVTLLGPTGLTATDEFVSSTVNLTASAVDTSLPDDTTQTLGARQVGN